MFSGLLFDSFLMITTPPHRIIHIHPCLRKKIPEIKSSLKVFELVMAAHDAVYSSFKAPVRNQDKDTG